MRRALAVGVVVAAAIGLVGCTTGAESEPEDSLDTGATSGVSASGTSPIVFAFVCADGSSERTETYTTYSAVWEDDRTDCTAERITGTEMSSQQRAAVQDRSGIGGWLAGLIQPGALRQRHVAQCMLLDLAQRHRAGGLIPAQHAAIAIGEGKGHGVGADHRPR